MSKDFKQAYKNNVDLKASQEERRNLLLEKQKRDRQNVQDVGRNLEEIFAAKRNAKKASWRKKQQHTFQELYGEDLSLQQSEWLREKPENMCDWLLVPCPKGQRSLVVAHNRHTAVYNRLGSRVAVFRSMLPGDGAETDALTILDCVYVREKNAFYVLDVLAFGGQQNLLYCEAEFRFFWLRSKWDEFEHLTQRSESNRKPFYLVQQYDFESSLQIAECLKKYPLWTDNLPQLDGFLFYHRFASYTCGNTPLVGWLFAFMVPDILGLTVNEQYSKPEGYENPFDYMNAFDERLEAKIRKNKERRDRLLQKTESNSNDCYERHDDEMDEDNKAEDGDEEDALKKLLDSERALEMEQGEEEFENDLKIGEVADPISLTSA